MQKRLWENFIYNVQNVASCLTEGENMSTKAEKRKEDKEAIARKKAMDEMKELHNLMTSLTHDTTISLQIDDNEPTAYYSFKEHKMVITRGCLPLGIEEFPIVYRKLQDGLICHESGHIVKTKPMWERWCKWIKSKKNQKLAHAIFNIIEDKRVNTFMEMRYRFDVGKRLHLLRELTAKTWEPVAHAKYDTNKDKLSKGAIIISALAQKGLYEGDISWVLKDLTDAEKQELDKLLNLLEGSRHSQIPEKLLITANEMYQILEPHTDFRDITFLLHAMIQDGKIKGTITGELKKLLEGFEKRIRKKLQEAAAKGKDAKDQDDMNKLLSAGTGTGANIPAPNPNWREYQRLRDKNEPEIQRLLAKLKKDLKPNVQNKTFQTRGRIMPGIVGKAYVSSLRRPVEDIYIHKETTLEKRKIAMAVVVDFSGSMTETEAKDVLTILGETFGRWCEDYAFSIFTFSDTYQKIKTNFEAYANTKGRIGGDIQSGGTMLALCLKDVAKMINAVEEDRTKMVVIASDFCLGDDNETKEIIQAMKDQNIKVIGVGMCMGSAQAARRFTDLYTFVKHPRDLPEKFIEVYEKAVL